MIEIREAIGKKGIKDFVCFPFSLYKNNPYWVPPIIKDEMEVFDPSINPVFKTAQYGVAMTEQYAAAWRLFVGYLALCLISEQCQVESLGPRSVTCPPFSVNQFPFVEVSFLDLLGPVRD